MGADRAVREDAGATLVGSGQAEEPGHQPDAEVPDAAERRGHQGEPPRPGRLELGHGAHHRDAEPVDPTEELAEQGAEQRRGSRQLEGDHDGRDGRTQSHPAHDRPPATARRPDDVDGGAIG
jgi:hypothetical protein